MPRMLRDLIERTVSEQPDLEIAGEVDEPALDECPDFLILGVEDADLPDGYRKLLLSCPRMRVVGLTAERREAFLYELAPRMVPLGELSPETLLEALTRAR
jgi:hypothetical protein